MKLLKDLVVELTGSEQLQSELKQVNDCSSLESFLKKNGCGASAAEFADFARFMKSRNQCEGEMSDDEAESVAGGVQAYDFSGFYFGTSASMIAAAFDSWMKSGGGRITSSSLGR